MLMGVKSFSDPRVALTFFGTLIPSKTVEYTDYKVIGLTIAITNLRVMLSSPRLSRGSFGRQGETDLNVPASTSGTTPIEVPEIAF